MILFIISVVINLIVVLIISMIALLPYFFLKAMTRKILYQMGINTYTIPEKIEKGYLHPDKAFTQENLRDATLAVCYKNDAYFDREKAYELLVEFEVTYPDIAKEKYINTTCKKVS